MLRYLELFRNRVVCPLCDGNGLIYKTTLIPLNKILYICDECEAAWFNVESISDKFLISLGQYIKEHGLTYKSIKLEDIDYYWYHKKEIEA